MKKIKSFTSIWNVEGVLYAIGDIHMPFPMPYTQIVWVVGTWAFLWIFGDLPPFSLIDNLLMKWICIPFGLAWFMSKKSFDGKKPYRYLQSVILYLLRPKQTYAGKKVIYRKTKVDEYITAVRREIYVPN